MANTPRGCFIVGTDTGVGKTAVAAALAHWMRQRGGRVGVMKPVETGLAACSGPQSDAERLRRAAGVTDPLEMVSPYQFDPPLAPLAAARAVGAHIDLDRIAAAFHTLAGQYEFMLVEGVGGVRVPLTGSHEVRDLVSLLGLPALVIGRAALGGINHALLTIEALAHRQVRMLTLVLNHTLPSGSSPEAEAQQASTVALLDEMAGIRVIGPVGYEKALEGQWDEGVESLARRATIAALGELLLAEA
jgi:dethiobiotin synthetase